MKRQSQQGVALVITLILLSVITFMAVTFLVVSRREAEQVNTTTQQAVAKFAADAIAQQAEAQIMATALSQSNGLNFGLLVSTNYLSPFYDPANNPNALTNVNYYHADGTPLNLTEQQQMLNNLIYLPRAPVFIVTNKNQLNPEFRFYHDLNRNGVYDTNGPVVEMDVSNTIPVQVVNNYVGDPEWVGILEHPDQRHSASNFFVARAAFIAVPIGNTLDVNFIHNQSKMPINPALDGFLRNQGVGSWEINLAAFLRVLNPNVWGDVGPIAGYTYLPADTNTWNVNYNVSSTGFSFADAAGILQYRYNGTYNNLSPFGALYQPTPFVNPGGVFGRDNIDGYSVGPLMTNIFSLASGSEGDFTRINAGSPWSGADNPNQFFTTQDFFSSSPYLAHFSNDLFQAGRMFDTNVPSPPSITNSFNRYTFYRMLAQLGFGSTPEPEPFPGSRKMNLNYNNLGSNGVALVSTNFVPWTPLQFFTNAADRLMRAQPELAALNLNLTNIQIYPTNYYTPAVHRLLQLAANIYDASTNRALTTNDLDFPSVFRPSFRKTGSGTNAFVYIDGFSEVTPASGFTFLNKPLDLRRPADLDLLQPVDTVNNVYGIPYIIGAKRGFPSFNKFEMAPIVQMARKMRITKAFKGQPPSQWRYDFIYVVGVSNLMGSDCWNSYSSYYTHPVNIFITNELTMALTNSYGATAALPANLSSVLIGSSKTITSWPGTPSLQDPTKARQTFSITLMTNVGLMPDSVWQPPQPTVFNTNINVGFLLSNPSTFPAPQWVLSITNRVRVIMQDIATSRLIDYVELGGGSTSVGLDLTRDLYEDMKPPIPQQIGKDNLWDTNRYLGNTTSVPTYGMQSQIEISMGNYQADWSGINLQQLGYPSVSAAQTAFTDFYSNPDSTNLQMQVPYSPSKRFSEDITWSANDPLVHYMVSDLNDLTRTNVALDITAPITNLQTVLTAVQKVSPRYQPWETGHTTSSQGPALFDLAYKDPTVSRSDKWDFPTGKYPNIGWLGRVHRGTPWQTIYLKSSSVDGGKWTTWTGDNQSNYFGINDPALSQPTNDWKLMDLFTVAPNDNASRGQLSINQTNLAAWAAILDGVLVITNTPGLVPLVIDPNVHSNAFLQIVASINAARASTNVAGQTFASLGQILSAPALTIASPFLNTNGTPSSANQALSDAVYERIPQQIMSLLRVGSSRYAIFAWGQSLKPADRSIVQSSGKFFGMCTNYQITGEVLTRTVVRFDNAPIPGQPLKQPHAIVESFNILGPD